jgi:hypothetical protein
MIRPLYEYCVDLLFSFNTYVLHFYYWIKWDRIGSNLLCTFFNFIAAEVEWERLNPGAREREAIPS